MRHREEGFRERAERKFLDGYHRFTRDGPYSTSEMTAGLERRERRESLYAQARVAVRLRMLVLLVWAVTVRLRDVGWPLPLAFAVFSPATGMKLFGSLLPAGAFLLMLLALGTVPGGPVEPEAGEAEPAAFKPAPLGQFSREA